MAIPAINVCPSTLRPGFNGYSPLAQAVLFGSRSRNVSPILPYVAPDKAMVERISIGGEEEKYGLILQKNNLVYASSGGTHILKPMPRADFELSSDLPANEHVSMQIAGQLFKIRTAACGLIFFEDGTPGYLTRRFDYKPDGLGRYQVEDFASLLGRTPELDGLHYKYDGSYLDIAQLIRRHVAAVPVVLLDFFRLLLVHYLIGNGDAHLKKFSLMETVQGDFVLSPAYGLYCSSMHGQDSLFVLALQSGLYEGDYTEKSFTDTGMYTGASFTLFAEKAGIPALPAKQILDEIIQAAPQAEAIVQRSFLSQRGKRKYMGIFRERLRLLNLR